MNIRKLIADLHRRVQVCRDYERQHKIEGNREGMEYYRGAAEAFEVVLGTFGRAGK